MRIKDEKQPAVMISGIDPKDYFFDERMWLHFKGLNRVEPFIYKLHLHIPVDFHNAAENSKILLLLEEAFNRDIISVFKVIYPREFHQMISSAEEIIQALQVILEETLKDFVNEDEKIDLRSLVEPSKLDYLQKANVFYDNQKSKRQLRDILNQATTQLSAVRRVVNHPITIMLPEHCDYPALYKLCCQLEEILKEVPSTNDYLSMADVPLSSHLSMRQERLEKYSEYLAVQDLHPNELIHLSEQCQQSSHYQELKALFTNEALKTNEIEILVVKKRVVGAQCSWYARFFKDILTVKDVLTNIRYSLSTLHNENNEIIFNQAFSRKDRKLSFKKIEKELLTLHTKELSEEVPQALIDEFLSKEENLSKPHHQCIEFLKKCNLPEFSNLINELENFFDKFSNKEPVPSMEEASVTTKRFVSQDSH